MAASDERFESGCRQAAELIRNASSLVITAGAGMGVDSGLPDFRGDRGFWNAYPMYERLGIDFVSAANPEHFRRDPSFGWGFYGHRAALYRDTVPHAGFAILLDWIGCYGLDYFVVTSNVDGQFQKAGVPEERILEVHGSIRHRQCLHPCCAEIWADDDPPEVDSSTMRAKSVPYCIRCGCTARPNILMFGDFSWISDRTDAQDERFNRFLQETEREGMVIVEMGAGSSVPTIRFLSERLGTAGGRVIRINPREAQIGQPHLSLACGALAGLSAVNDLLAP